MNDSPCPNCEELIPADAGACPVCGHLTVDQPCDRHPERKAVGACVICGLALCKSCDHSQGRHHVCADHSDIPLISGWAQVYLAVSEIEAELIRENLVAEGIEAQILSQKDLSFAVELGELSQVRVLVPAFAFGDAVTLIAQHLDASGEVAFACLECGEAYEPGQLSCANCGAQLPTSVRSSPT